MGKAKIEEAKKELDRMSKRMKRVARLLVELDHIDSEFDKKADELMSASLTIENWSEAIFKEFIEEKLNENRVGEIRGTRTRE